MTGTPIEQKNRKVISHEEFLKKKLQQKRQNEKRVMNALTDVTQYILGGIHPQTIYFKVKAQ